MGFSALRSTSTRAASPASATASSVSSRGEVQPYVLPQFMAREKGISITKVAMQPPTSMALCSPACLGTLGSPIKQKIAPTARMGRET